MKAQFFKIVLLGGVVLGGSLNGFSLCHNNAKADGTESLGFTDLTDEGRQAQRHQMAEQLSEALTSAKEAQPVGQSTRALCATEAEAKTSMEWSLVAGNVVSASGACCPIVSPEQADSLYEKYRKAYYRHPAVVAKGAAFCTAALAKPVGIYLYDWVCEPGIKLAAGQILAYYWAPALVNGLGAVSGAAVGAVAGPIPGMVVSKTFYGMNAAANIIPGAAPLRQFVVGRTAIEPILPYLYRGLRNGIPQLWGQFKNAVSVLRAYFTSVPAAS